MARTKWSVGFLMVYLALASSRCTAGAARGTPDRDRAAAALFARFETVFYSKADLVSGTGSRRLLPELVRDLLQRPYAELVGGLGELSKQEPAAMLGRAAWVLVGAKDFRSPVGPTGFGAVHSHYCYILNLAGARQFDLGGWIRRFPAVVRVAPSIWRWTVPPGEGEAAPVEIYATQAGRAYLLIANDVDELKMVATTLVTAERTTDLGGVCDWANLTKHEIWGYRRYRHGGYPDPTAAGTEDVTPDAECLAFFVNPERRAAVLHMRSTTGETIKAWERNPRLKRLLPPFKAVGRGIFETNIPLADAQAPEQLFVVMALFGLGVYV
jgi:hypothetical protein